MTTIKLIHDPINPFELQIGSRKAHTFLEEKSERKMNLFKRIGSVTMALFIAITLITHSVIQGIKITYGQLGRSFKHIVLDYHGPWRFRLPSHPLLVIYKIAFWIVSTGLSLVANIVQAFVDKLAMQTQQPAQTLTKESETGLKALINSVKLDCK